MFKNPDLRFLLSYDKIAHFLMYFVFTVLWIWGYLRKNNLSINSSKVFWRIAIISFLYGIILEFLQNTIAIHRQFEVWDIIANGLGVLFGILFVKRFIK